MTNSTSVASTISSKTILENEIMVSFDVGSLFYKLAFLDTAVSREPDCNLATGVYRLLTHTDQYLADDSRHPQSVERGIVKCLCERAKRLVTIPSVSIYYTSE